jgi:DNA-binding GntR family transcriptional regulator
MSARPMREIIYNKIIQDLGQGRIAPGEKLAEEQLAAFFNVSRTPVREALLQLEKKGLIILHANSGAVVKKITGAQIEEIFDILSVLEAYGVETVASRGIGKEDLSYLKKVLQEMENTRKTKNYFRYAEEDAKFHTFFIHKLGNSHLSEIIEDLRNRMYMSGLTTPLHIHQYLSKHKAIILALSRKSPSQAGAAMREHFQEIKKFLIETLTQYGEIRDLRLHRLGNIKRERDPGDRLKKKTGRPGKKDSHFVLDSP